MKFIKKGIAIIIAVILIFSCISCIFQSKIFAVEIVTVYIDGTNVCIRSTPSKPSTINIIEKVSNISGTLLEEVHISSSEVWYKISYISDGVTKEGYVFYDPEYIRVVRYNPDADFETKLLSFPESYRDDLRTLHAKYPNWEFIADNVNVSFEEAVYQQTLNLRKLVSLNSQPISWRSMGLGAYDWNTGDWVNTQGGWTGASKEIIAYYMDPRNFLNSSEIYMFMQQSYNSAIQNEAGVNAIISGTFLSKRYSPASGEIGNGYYSKVIMSAAQQSGVSPYVIAAKIIQEQGTSGTSSLISGNYPGYEGYYNFFNVGATGGNSSEVIRNGLTYAVKNGWRTRYLSILGGANFLGKSYINSGQDTYYYQDFNIRGGGSHQYAQAVHDAYNKGLSLKKNYQNNSEISLSFKIPVFTNMPEAASAKPESNDSLNNYYFTDISVNGLTPTFNMFTNNYNLSVSSDTVIAVSLPTGAEYISNDIFYLNAGNNLVNLVVKSDSGYNNTYSINIYTDNPCKIRIQHPGAIHDFSHKGNNYLVSNATCTKPAVYFYECSICGAQGEETYEYGLPLGHSENWITDIEPSFLSNGLEINNCNICNQTVGSREVPKLILGDSNRDGVTNALDLANYRKMLVNSEEFSKYEIACADFNFNSKIDTKDLVRLKKLLAFIIK